MTIYRFDKTDLSITLVSKRKVKRGLSGHYQDVDLIFCALVDGHVIETPFAIYATELHKMNTSGIC